MKTEENRLLFLYIIYFSLKFKVIFKYLSIKYLNIVHIYILYKKYCTYL